MQATERPEQPFEPIVRLTAQWRRGGAWLGPAWAVLCGIVAAARFQWSAETAMTVLIAAILAEGIWTTLWASIAGTDWATPLSRWRAWTGGEPVRALPYTQPGSPAARLAIVLGQYRDWARRDLFPNYGVQVASVLVAPLIALVLSAVLGAPALLLTLLAICVPQAALLLCQGNGQPNPWLRGLVEMAAPMLLGFVILKPLSIEIVVAALGFGIAYSGAVARRWDTRAWNLGQLVVLAELIAMRHPVGASVLLLLWVPQFLLQAQSSTRNAQWWLMASMLVTALAIA
jgi:hypothetical protein